MFPKFQAYDELNHLKKDKFCLVVKYHVYYYIFLNDIEQEQSWMEITFELIQRSLDIGNIIKADYYKNKTVMYSDDK